LRWPDLLQNRRLASSLNSRSVHPAVSSLNQRQPELSEFADATPPEGKEAPTETLSSISPTAVGQHPNPPRMDVVNSETVVIRHDVSKRTLSSEALELQETAEERRLRRRSSRMFG
jgi:hypothetical protein